jgi:hypothetical protein
MLVTEDLGGNDGYFIFERTSTGSSYVQAGALFK